MTGQLGREVVIVGAVRTPIGRGHPEKGCYRDIHPATLLARTLAALIERTGIDPALVEDVTAGCAFQFGEQMMNIARTSWLQAGFPIEAGATTVDSRCGSGQQAVDIVAAKIAAGIHDVGIGCGIEHMARSGFTIAQRVRKEIGEPFTAEFLARYPIKEQGLCAEEIADQWDVPRSELDALALRSHTLAAAATDSGAFAREIVAIDTPGGPVTADQGIRRETSAESLAALKPVFKEGGKVTAGSSSQISDGAAAILLMSADKARELGITPRARVVDHTTVGVDPVTMLTGPIPATRKMLERNGLTIGDFDRMEVNEAFAPVVAAWQRELGADLDRVNTRGGAIAVGHPLGCTGTRLLTTLLHSLEDDDGELGLVTMCCGGGLGTATVIQRL
jgi:acetyl-CoA acetyltransferase family protein